MSMVNIKNLGFGGSGVPDALPKAIAELQGMKLSVVTGAAAGTVVPVPGMDPEDHIGSAVNLTDLTDVPLNTLSVAERNAKATITCLATVVDGDKVAVNGKTYTFKNVRVHPSYNAPPGVVPIEITPSGADPEDMAERLSKAIMSGDSSVTASVGPDVSSPPKMAMVTVKVRQAGTSGNAYTLTETGNAVTISGATFTGGSATGTSGFTSSVSLAGKKILVLWYDKRPGAVTNPLLFQVLTEAEQPYALSVTALEPDSAEVGDESFTLHVHGTGFGPEAKIVFNGYEEPTTFVSPTEITTGVNMAVWTNPSNPLPVKVRTGLGDDSNEMMFQFHAAGTTPAGLGAREGRSGPGNLNIKTTPKKTGR